MPILVPITWEKENIMTDPELIQSLYKRIWELEQDCRIQRKVISHLAYRIGRHRRVVAAPTLEKNGDVAQVVEQRAHNASVEGPNPSVSTNVSIANA